jgi:hypothetical protein
MLLKRTRNLLWRTRCRRVFPSRERVTMQCQWATFRPPPWHVSSPPPPHQSPFRPSATIYLWSPSVRRLSPRRVDSPSRPGRLGPDAHAPHRPRTMRAHGLHDRPSNIRSVAVSCRRRLCGFVLQREGAGGQVSLVLPRVLMAQIHGQLMPHHVGRSADSPVLLVAVQRLWWRRSVVV